MNFYSSSSEERVHAADAQPLAPAAWMCLCAAIILLLWGTWLKGPVGWAMVLLVATALLGAVLYMALLWPRRAATGISSHELQNLQLLYNAVEQNPDSMLLVDLNGHLVYANQAFYKHTGYAREEALGRPSLDVSANGISAQERVHMRQLVEQGVPWRSILNNRRKDGSTLAESICISPVRDAQGQLTHFMELKQDITERLQAQQRITQLLNFDTLTLLPNRFALSRKLQELLDKSKETGAKDSGYWHALLLLDMDRFAKFNAGRGIEWGDALLRAIALKLSSLVPQSAWVARTNADEFAVVLENVALSRLDARMMCYALATELQRGLSAQVVMHQKSELVQVSFCMGMTVFPFVEPSRKNDSVDHILRRASMAMHQAKSKGVGQIHTFSESLVEVNQRNLEIEKGLYEALQKDQLRLFIQTQVDMEDRVTSIEVLLRWEHPEQGLISPGQFIPVAEESDLIVQLGDWVLKQIESLLSHPSVYEAGLGISVNISARQFQQPDFIAKIKALVERTGSKRGRLTLEVTESMVLNDVEDAIHTMVALRGIGVDFALDDFGTGYSSLSYLQRLPIQEIKIDQSFIHDLEPDAESGALVQALLMVAKRLGLRVVAEGVESAEQAEVLRAWDPAILCQGYLFSRPIPAAEWLEQLGQPPLANAQPVIGP